MQLCDSNLPSGWHLCWFVVAMMDSVFGNAARSGLNGCKGILGVIAVEMKLQEWE